MEAFLIVVLILFLIIAFLLHKVHCYKLQNRLFNHVSWCVGGDSMEYLRTLPLLDIICNAQVKHAIPKEYCILQKNERVIANDILKHFQTYLEDAYFKGNLSCDRSIMNMNSQSYFFYFLKYFLEKFECETYFHENQMYTTKSYKSFGRWGGELFKATYVLTDYSVVYHKLLYSVRLWFLDFFKDKLQDDSIAQRSADYSKKVLDTKEIEISNI